MSHSRAVRRLTTVAAAVATALALTLAPTAAHAAGWHTIAKKDYSPTITVKSAGKSVYVDLRNDFRVTSGVRYRQCVRVKGTKAEFTLQGVRIKVDTSSWVTKCVAFTRSGSDAYSFFSLYVNAGTLQINRSTVDRYSTGSVPV